jgi:hypothetical protein
MTVRVQIKAMSGKKKLVSSLFFEFFSLGIRISAAGGDTHLAPLVVNN